MYSLARNLLFRFNPETAHDITVGMLKYGDRVGLVRPFAQHIPSRPVEVMGLRFDNPVGLAAGLDKNADCLDGLGELGFGFIEVGTVTPRPQSGNEKPRLFRIVEKEAIINRMGFNNKGVDYLVNQVRQSRYKGIVGINIGKNRDTPVEKAVDDYLICLRKVYPYAGYIAVNLSSPNTPGLRQLQFGETLDELLSALKSEQKLLSEQHGCYKPIAVKIAPDMTDDEIRQIAQRLAHHKIDGVIATNTTVDRQGVIGSQHAEETGGLSGAPLEQRSTEVIRVLASELKGAMPIIGVGGICSGKGAAEKVEAGASLVQLYSGFIYHGPDLILEAADGIASVAV